MSSIDQRIVEMQFKNSDFERGIKESLKSLEALKKGLDLDNSVKSMQDLQRAGNSFSMARMANAIEGVSSKFTLFGQVGLKALDRISTKVVDLGERMLKSLTIDQVSAGWTKYTQKTASVQTIMNATGKSVEEVNECLDELMWFSDETSYNFTEMTDALGTMTASGGSVEKLIPMIEGMASATAFAGKSASEFSRVIYNLNQSYGQGFLSYMDWRSVELAGVGSEQLKQTLIDTAVAMGTLQKASDGAARTANGTLVTVGSMASTLSERWATAEVMEEAFGQFGTIFQEAYRLVQEGQFDTAADALASLSGEYDDVFFKAAKAAQEAKSFNEAIEATKDAVSSGWMKSFELIFGNKDEATALWTDLANALYEVFASGSEARNEMLSMWHDLGGRDVLIQGITDTLYGLWGIVVAVKEAFADIFPPVTVDTLMSISEAVGNFGANLREGLYWRNFETKEGHFVKVAGEQIEEFEGILKKGITGEAVQKLQERLGSLGYDVGPAGPDGVFGSKTLAALKEFQTDFGLVVDGVYGKETHNKLKEIFGEDEYVLEEVAQSFMILGDAIGKVKDLFRGLFTIVKAGLKILKLVWNVFSVGYKIILKPILDGAFTVLSVLFGTIADIGQWVENAAAMFAVFGATIAEFTSPVTQYIQGLIEVFASLLGLGFERIGEVFLLAFSGVVSAFDKLKSVFANLGIVEKITSAFEKIKMAITGLKEAFSVSGQSIIGNWWKKILSVLKIVGSSVLTGIVGLIGGMVYAAVTAIAKLVDILAPLVAIFPYYINKIQNFFIELWSVFKSTKFAQALTPYAEKIASFFVVIRNGISDFVKNPSEGIPKIKAYFVDLLAVIRSSEFISKMQPYAEKIKNFFITIWTAVTDFVKDPSAALERIKNFFSELWKTIKEFVSNARESVKNKIDTGPFGTLFTIFAKISQFWKKYKTAILLLSPIIYAVKLVFSLIGGVRDLIEKIGDALESIKTKKLKIPKNDTFENIANGLLKIAASVALLIAAIVILGKLKPATLIQGGIALGAIILVLGSFVTVGAILAKKGLAKGISETAKSIKSLAIGILLITACVAILGRMKTETLLKGIGSVVVLMAAVTLMVRFIGDKTISLAGFAAIATIISAMARTVKKLGKMKLPDLAKGISGLVVIMATMVLAVREMSKLSYAGDAKSIMKLLLSFSFFIYVFGLVINKIKHVDPKVMLAFSASLAIALGSLIAACAIAQNGKIGGGIKGMSKGALAISAAIGIIVGSLTLILLALGTINNLSQGGFVKSIKSGGKVIKALANALEPLCNELGLAIGVIAAISLALGETLKSGGISGAASGAVIAGLITITLGVVVAVAEAFVAGMGGINDATGGGFVSVVKGGGRVLSALGSALEPLGGKLGLVIGIIGAISITLGEALNGAGITGAAIGVAIAGLITLAIGVIVAVAEALVAGMGAINDATGGGFVEKLNSGGDVLAALGTAIGSFFGGISAGNLERVQEGLKAFSKIDIDKTQSSAAVALIEKIVELAKSLGNTGDTNVNMFGVSVTKMTGFTSFCDSMPTLATSVTTFATEVEKINQNGTVDTVTALGICTKIATFLSNIAGDKYTIEEKDNSFLSFFKGKNETDSLTSYMTQLGSAVRTFATEAAGMGDSKIVKDAKAMSKAVESIADVLNYISGDDVTIEKRDAWWKRLFVGENGTESLISYLPKLAEKVKEMGDDISGLSETTIVSDATAAKKTVEKFAGMLTGLSKSVIMGLSDDNTDTSNLGKRVTDLGTMITDIGVAISSFDNTTADADLQGFQDFVDEIIRIISSLDGMEIPDMSGLSEAINSLRSLFTTEGADAITSENFLKGLDIGKVSEKLGTFTSGLSEVISSNAETMAGYTNSFNDAGSSLISAVSSGMAENSDTSAVSSLCTKMVTTLNGHAHFFRTAGVNFGIGLGNGIESTSVYVRSKAAYVASQAAAAAKAAFDEHSPSKVGVKIGAFFSEGLGIGIEDNAGSAIRSSENMAERIIGNARNGLSALSAIIEDNMDADPVVRPVMDLSDVRNGARVINGMIPGSASIFASASLSRANAVASSVSSRKLHQNGNDAANTANGTVFREDNAVNLSGNNFYIRSENDIHLLASEIASLTRSQQRSMGGSF